MRECTQPVSTTAFLAPVCSFCLHIISDRRFGISLLDHPRLLPIVYAVGLVVAVSDTLQPQTYLLIQWSLSLCVCVSAGTRRLVDA